MQLWGPLRRWHLNRVEDCKASGDRTLAVLAVAGEDGVLLSVGGAAEAEAPEAAAAAAAPRGVRPEERRRARGGRRLWQLMG